MNVCRGKRIKQALRRCVIGEQGSVSVYFMVILAALFFFHAVLIDFARIKVAEKQAETALRAALRSTLADFDTALLPYGLYALHDEERGLDVLKSILDEHVLPEREAQEFRFIDPHWDHGQTTLRSHYSLAHRDVFKQQVLEEMKYEAPLQFMFEVADKLIKTDTMEEMSEASAFTKEAEQLEQLIIDRERSLDRAWSIAESMVGAGGDIPQFYSKYERRLNEIKTSAEQIIAMDSHEDDEEEEVAAAKLQALASLLNQLMLAQVTVLYDYDVLSYKLGQMKQHLADAQHHNEQLIHQINQLPNKEGHLQEARLELSGQVDIKPRIYFEQFEVGMSNVVSLFNGFYMQFDVGNMATAEDVLRKYDHLVTGNRAYYEQGNLYDAKQRPIEERRQSERADMEQRQQEGIGQIAHWLTEIKALFSSCSDGAHHLYEQLATESDTSSLDLDDASSIGKQSMNLADLLKASMLNARDKVYINEYALAKFNYRTADFNDRDDSLFSHSPHLLFNQEVEYILYGLDSCHKNQIAAFGEIFALRLAIRTVEALLNPKGAAIRAGSPLLIILFAVAEGASKAYVDMKKLVAGDEVELSARLAGKVMVNYRDYLRLFLLIHGREEKMLQRMQALIQLNIGHPLNEKVTYIEGEAVLAIKLWFIPGVMKLLNYDVSGREAKIKTQLFINY